MGAGASAREEFNVMGCDALADAADAAKKPSAVSRAIRDNEIDGATALLMSEADVEELAAKKLDRIKLVAAHRQLTATSERSPAEIEAAPVSDDDSGEDNDPFPARALRIPAAELVDRKRLGESGRFVEATWRTERVAVVLKIVGCQALAEAFVLRVPHPNVLHLYGASSDARDMFTVAERAEQ